MLNSFFFDKIRKMEENCIIPVEEKSYIVLFQLIIDGDDINLRKISWIIIRKMKYKTDCFLNKC